MVTHTFGLKKNPKQNQEAAADSQPTQTGVKATATTAAHSHESHVVTVCVSKTWTKSAMEQLCAFGSPT